jgi:hypothetical protein
MRLRARSLRAAAALVVSTLLLLAACAERAAAPSPAATGVARQAIVNGQVEPGWESVGALTLRVSGMGYLGAFCTGTLIDAQWVLTAAHCLYPIPSEGFDPQPDQILFYVGPDARPGPLGWPAEGALHEVDAIFPHPAYDPNTQWNDIGLVHLAEPLADVPPVPYSVATFTREFVGRDVFYVGFGVDDGARHTGSGVRRSTTLNVSDYNAISFFMRFVASNVCFGDSGGPGLMDFDGVWQIVGVVSGGTAEDCLGGVDVSTRVDAYADWLSDVTGTPLPTCLENPARCACAEACQEDGTCRNGLCRDFDCEAQLDCFVSCPATNEACRQECRDRGTDDAAPLFAALEACFAAPCAGDWNPARCARDRCPTEYYACIPRVVGEQTCDEVYACVVACGDDWTCSGGCSEQGTAEAQDQYRALRRCLRSRCGNVADEAAYQRCAAESCVSEINTCRPPSDCDLAGGGCAAGEACYVRGPDTTDCGASAGLAAGAACDPTAAGALPCADGLLCRAGEGHGAACVRWCTADADCAEGGTCALPVTEWLAAAGACVGGTSPEPDAGGADAGAEGAGGEDAAPPVGADVVGADTGARPGADAAPRTDAGADPSADAAGAGDTAGSGGGGGGGGGCSAAAAGAGAPGLPAALLLVAALALALRRRRGRSSGAAR